MKRLLTIGHSYVVAANRALAHHMAIQGRGAWQVTAVAPARFRGDLRVIDVEPIPEEASALETAPVRLDRVPHLMWFGGRLRDILSRDWDVVHCWEEPYTFAASRIAALAGARAAFVVASFQNISKAYPWPLSAFERESLARADGWIAFGRTAADTLGRREGYLDKPHRVIPPGVDVEIFRPGAAAAHELRRLLGWPADALVVGYLGRFVPAKGIADLCEALRRCTADWRGLFVGGGPQAAEIDRLAAAHPGRVKVLTGVAHGEVPRWLNAMTVLCAPSRSTAAWREQFGRMLVEAMACGVPVLASDSGEMPAVVADAGRILPERSPAVWARELDAILADAGARETMAAAGRDRAVAEFAWPVVARRHLEFFDALLDGRRSS